VALVIGTAQDADLWAWDLERSTLTRVTTDSGSDNYPVWTPDARRLVYARDGNLYIRAADGTGTAERLTESERTQFPTGISPDGTRVVFYEYMLPTVLRDLRLLMLRPSAPSAVGTAAQGIDGRSEAVTLLETPFNERFGILSPDGRWLAYEADPSGAYEIYVRPFPNVGDGQWQISTGGGRQPVWNRNGQELIYVGPGNALLAVPIETRGTTWKAGRPTRLFASTNLHFGNLARMYDISPDGQRFLMLADSGDRAAVSPQIVVVQNWLEELKRLVPIP